MSEFKREERFIVIKRKYLYAESRVHESLEQELRVWLDKHLIPTSECVVVESDWPEYEQIWRMIEARVTGQLSDYDRLAAENLALKEANAKFQHMLADVVVKHFAENIARSTAQKSMDVYLSEGISMLEEELSALRSRVAVVPERQNKSDPWCEGWDYCLDELARLNGKTVSEGLLREAIKWLDAHAPANSAEQVTADELRAILGDPTWSAPCAPC